MILLTTTAHPTMERWASPHHGRLLTPRLWCNVDSTIRSGTVWAVDNDGFNGFDAGAFTRMVLGLSFKDGCLFVNAPDVFDKERGVGDHEATLALLPEWEPLIRMAGFPVSFVLQNGANPSNVPWDNCDAVFIGGSTDWKLGAEAEAIVRRAKQLGKHVHMGRVNSLRRIRYAQSIGVDSIDGTGWAKYRDAMMPLALNALAAGEQLRFALETSDD